MAKGALAKEQIFQKMLEMFDGSFMYNGGKELRIPWDEEGNEVQIKVALTCAKENVSVGGEVPRSAAAVVDSPVVGTFASQAEAANIEPTEEEKQNLEDLMKALGL